MTPKRYGRTKISRIMAKLDRLRKAIRSEGTPEIQEAWDAYEAFAYHPFQGGLHEDEADE